MANGWIDLDPEALREIVRWHGARLDWWRALPCPCQMGAGTNQSLEDEGGCALGCLDGWSYALQIVPEEIADSLGIITDYNKTVYHPEFGRVPSGEAKWVSMADECELGDHDILVNRDTPELSRTLIVRGAGDFDELPHPCVESVSVVARGFEQWSEGPDFVLERDSSGRFERARLRWSGLNEGGAPLSGQMPPDGEYYSVEYHRLPRLTWLSDGNRPARRNADGAILVQRGSLTILPLTGDNQ